MSESVNGEVPLTEQAQEAKEVMQRELLRSMANKMYATALEEERDRRIKEMKNPDEDSVKRNAYEQLMVVQEDLIRTLNLMKVKAEADKEQMQRITEEKKAAVHDELIRKSAMKEADKLTEEERERRISEGQLPNEERRKIYDKLVLVQEDLLKTIHTMKANEEARLEQERHIIEGKKNLMQQELIHSVGVKNANSEMDKEKTRRTEDLSEEEIQRRVAIAHKLIDVQKELLATRKPVEPIGGTMSQEVLEEAKAFFQEQLIRKAAQKEALAAMDEEKERRISETTKPTLTDAQADVLEAINRTANVKKVKELVDATQQEYINAEAKARVQEETVRKVNQKQVDKAMDKEQEERVLENTGKKQPQIEDAIKKELQSLSK